VAPKPALLPTAWVQLASGVAELEAVAQYSARDETPAVAVMRAGATKREDTHVVRTLSAVTHPKPKFGP
jgi:hypothetical protein